MLGAVWCRAHRKDTRTAGDRPGHADDRFLRHVAFAHARHGKHEGANEGEAERQQVRARIVEMEVEQNRHRRPQRRELRQGQVDEDDAAREHVHAEVAVNGDQNQTRQPRHPHDGKQLAQPRAFRNVLSSSSTRSSNKAMGVGTSSSAPTAAGSTTSSAPVRCARRCAWLALTNVDANTTEMFSFLILRSSCSMWRGDGEIPGLFSM